MKKALTGITLAVLLIGGIAVAAQFASKAPTQLASDPGGGGRR